VITITVTDARIAPKTVPDMEVAYSPSILLSAAEHVLTEVVLGNPESSLMKQQEEANKIA
jgi:hypothetical protein